MKKDPSINSSSRAGTPGICAPLASQMKVDFLFNEDGHVWLLHEKPLADTLKWVEYDGDMESVTLVMADDKIQDLGLRLPRAMGMKINAKEITAMQMEDGKVADFCVVPILLRNLSVH